MFFLTAHASHFIIAEQRGIAKLKKLPGSKRALQT
jgi:hypothetical protein